MFELSKQFRFEAAHTLTGRAIDAAGSRRIHGHSYRAEVVVRGEADPATGMVVDFGLLARAMATAEEGLDHQFLDEVPALGRPTMESLARWIWGRLSPSCAGLHRVTVHRDSAAESCSYFGGRDGGA